MCKSYLFLAIAFIFSIQTAFANEKMMSPSCVKVAKACKSAGYTREEGVKQFWKQCMKPVIMGQTVKNVKIDADTVKACRTDKIDKMKKEINELESAK